MQLAHLLVDGFRNLAPQSLAVPPGLTLLVGPNGAGKTSLLEAVAVLGNLVSFRGGSAAAWICRGRTAATLEARLSAGNRSVELRQRIQLGGRLQRVLYRGARRLGAGEYLTVFPVVALSTADRLLVFGPPHERRHFLDRLAFHLHPELLTIVQRYRRALAQRNAALVHAPSTAALDAFEHELASCGAHLMALRREATRLLQQALDQVLDEVGWQAGRVVLRYHASDGRVAEGDEAAVARALRADLLRSRAGDRRRGHTSVGPHRHDVWITVQGVQAREALSAGQGKLLAVGLRLAGMEVLGKRRGEAVGVVFDDIDAELDSEALARVLARLAREPQVLASSAHPEMLAGAVATVWPMRDGAVVVGKEGSSQ